MTRIDELPPDQRAVLSLVLRRRKSYAEIAAALEIGEPQVRRLAHTALSSLAPDAAAALEQSEREQIGDFVLAQLAPADRLVAYDRIEGSPAAQAYAEELSGQVAELAGAAAPEGERPAGGTPTETASASSARSGRRRRAPVGGGRAPTPQEPPPAAPAIDAAAAASAGQDDHPRPASRQKRARAARGPSVAERARRAGRGVHGVGASIARDRKAAGERPAGPPGMVSRRGGAVLLALIAIGAIVAVVLISSSGGQPSTASAGATAGSGGSTGATGAQTAGSGAQVKSVKRIKLNPPDGSSSPIGAAEVGEVTEPGKAPLYELAIVADKLRPTQGFHYVLWLRSSESEFDALGKSPSVSSNGVLAPSSTPLPADAARFHELILTKETSERPTHPGEVVLSGPFGLH